ncbi:MAG: YceI family protein [Anaerolineae bacterium]|nr:YceI family protein [Anaerolineae bacterium]
MAWVIDNAHTRIEFVAKHMMITNVRGGFKNYSGTVQIDETNPQNSKVEVSIDVASLQTGDEKRDGHLKSADFFDVEKYPTMTFKSKRVELPAPNSTEHFKLIGDLTIKDVTKEVVLDVTNEGRQKTPWGTTAAGFTASTSVNRKDWGLTWNVALEAGGWLVGDTIKINIETELVQQPEAVTEAAAEKVN